MLKNNNFSYTAQNHSINILFIDGRLTDTLTVITTSYHVPKLRKSHADRTTANVDLKSYFHIQQFVQVSSGLNHYFFAVDIPQL